MMQARGEGDGSMHTHLLTLPDETLIRILRCLHFKDLARLSLACRRLRLLTQDGSLWDWQCRQYYLCDQCEKSWKATFVRLHRLWGRYPCYAEIRRAWDRVEAFLDAHCPALRQALLDGVSEDELDDVEADLRVTLPQDLRLSYRLHNGQDNHTHTSPGVMGGGIIYTHKVSFALNPISKLQSSYEEQGPFAGCAVLAEDTYLGTRQLVCLRGVAGYTEGHVYQLCGLEELVEDIDCFIAGTSFTDWFCSYAEKLSQDVGYRVIDDHIYRFYSASDCVATICGITVRPTACFMPELSRADPPLFFYAYRITMSMAVDADPDLACKLETRHWTITDGDGEEQVQGSGVVGEYPEMRPGAKFDWVSCSTFSTPYGNMRGHFKMRNLLTGSMVEVQCPCFHMRAPPIVTAAQRATIVARLALTKPEHDGDSGQAS